MGLFLGCTTRLCAKKKSPARGLHKRKVEYKSLLAKFNSYDVHITAGKRERSVDCLFRLCIYLRRLLHFKDVRFFVKDEKLVAASLDAGGLVQCQILRFTKFELWHHGKPGNLLIQAHITTPTSLSDDWRLFCTFNWLDLQDLHHIVSESFLQANAADLGEARRLAYTDEEPERLKVLVTTLLQKAVDPDEKSQKFEEEQALGDY